MFDKFRVFDTAEKKMYYPKSFVDGDCGNSDLSEILNYTDFAISTHGYLLKKEECDWSLTYKALKDEIAKRYKVMEAIGMKDQNDKYIYYLDLVKLRLANDIYIIEHRVQGAGYVFLFKNMKQYYCWSYDPSEIEIVGNFYENPELLD